MAQRGEVAFSGGENNRKRLAFTYCVPGIVFNFSQVFMHAHTRSLRGCCYISVNEWQSQASQPEISVPLNMVTPLFPPKEQVKRHETGHTGMSRRWIRC